MRHMSACFLLLFGAATSAVHARSAEDAPTGPQVREVLEILACRTPETLLKMLGTGVIPTDAEIIALNKRHKQPQCELIDSAELRVVRETRRVMIQDITGSVLEVSRLLDKRAWYVFSQ